CQTCHVDGDENDWVLVTDSRGHEIHLNSVDPVLQELQCVTCHSPEVHEFRASDASCSQRGCHDESTVRLAGMAHIDVGCVSCHDFLSPLATAAGSEDPASLRPTGEQCLSCHEMREHVSFALEEDEPHGAECGLCHNAHTQRVAADALVSCTEALCHAVPEKVDDDHHQWPSIRLGDCTQCHQAHTFKVDGDDCTSCHGAVIAALDGVPGSEAVGGPPLRPVPAGGPLGSFVGIGVGWGPAPLVLAAAVQSRSFQHERHRSVECRNCHTTGTSVVRGDAGWCNSCHHSRNRTEASCARCHRGGGSADVPFNVVMDLPGGPEERELTFPHQGHASRSCSDCHGSPPGPVAEDFSCVTCHQEHHESETVDCLQCHTPPARWAHAEALVHRTCSGGICHTGVGEGLPETWPPSMCSACHTEFRGGEIPPLPLTRADTALWTPWAGGGVSGVPPQRHP
ncbi:MAG TPA: hypothetical protein VLA43_10075, partial [Longimicrobiales bacterium]|nr:hypothetical protein [Longimicrobiales bacterium]